MQQAQDQILRQAFLLAKIATNIIIKLCGGECRDFVFASDKTQEKKILKFDKTFHLVSMSSKNT